MKIVKYIYKKTIENDWDFSEVEFSRINLLVGASGTGKTRFMNTMINFLTQLTLDKIRFSGEWIVEFELLNKRFRYHLHVKPLPENFNEMIILEEELINLTDSLSIIKRQEDVIEFLGKEIPKLNNKMSCFVLLNEQDEIKEIYKNLKFFAARRFFDNEISKSFQVGSLHPNVTKEIIRKKDRDRLIGNEIDFHNKIYLLSQIDRPSYEEVCALIKEAFPFIEKTLVKNISETLPGLNLPVHAPVFCIKEEGLDQDIVVSDISSGMQKMFLLILDTVLMKDGGILFIDEYENSLGINAINYLPDLIEEIGEQCQFIMTSHHPYIINNIDVRSWKVFHRKGKSVEILDGREIEKKFKDSKQEHFTQLINNSFYRYGIE